MHATVPEDFTITLDVRSLEEHPARSALVSTTVIATIYWTDTTPAGAGTSPQLSVCIIEVTDFFHSPSTSSVSPDVVLFSQVKKKKKKRC